MTERTTRAEYYCQMTELAADRSPCLRRKIGAIITVDGRLVATGYNGPPAKHRHCETCLKGEAPSGTALELCPAIHAEANAILQAAKYGIPIKGGTIYSSVMPCFECLKLIVNSGIDTVFYLSDYTPIVSNLYLQIVVSSGITITKLNLKKEEV